MVQEGDLCPTCGVGKIYAFQCENPDCGAKWDAISKTKYRIESRKKKQSARPKSDSKGRMNKMKNTAQPRRQEPR